MGPTQEFEAVWCGFDLSSYQSWLGTDPVNSSKPVITPTVPDSLGIGKARTVTTPPLRNARGSANWAA
ncbi:hypothetical protein COLO4_16445 [Corchorus olitorius]|uniref:Uncharacterized protein n=1 Tax=Corchorus olitorius TaxID=93759 RepID=A0A1R3JHM1_9ROSI|nr:hypothetical protein COLO4_16445 [Corchorus olitorius]